MTNKMKTNLDRPIQSEKEDSLYYNELYAEKLENILEENSKNCVKIGLFAKFGSGKTSTINLLWERLKQKKKNTLKRKKRLFVHVKSIWDYSPADILKKILVETDKQGELKLGYGNNINAEITLINSNKKIINIFAYLVISLGIIAVSIIISQYKIPLKIPDATIQLTIGLITLGLAVFFAIETFKKQTKKSPASSYDFEDYWGKILIKLKKKRLNQITLVVDDLDRCKPEIVNGIFGKLNTIVEKTENYSKINIALIIPFSLADYFIITHDKEVERLKHNYKKFFDLIIDMPELGSLELQRLSKNEN